MGQRKPAVQIRKHHLLKRALMYDRFIEQVDAMLDGEQPDWSVLVKYQRSLNGKSADWVVMAQIAKRAVERGAKKRK